VECLDTLIREALATSGLTLAEMDAVAATAGPGLIGGLMVGLTTAKAIVLATGKPLLAVNHLEGHALTVGLTDGLRPPYLLLLVSGGHTQLLLVEDVGAYRRLGTTIDDALGEAFDKTAKLLGLGLPGGPRVEAEARRGDPTRIPLPAPMIGRAAPDFSFAGLKTAVRQQAQKRVPLGDQDVADLCAAFQAAVATSVADRVSRAMAIIAEENLLPAARHLVVAGGVAANMALAERLGEVARRHGYALCVPPRELCADNAAMIAWAGIERFRMGLTDGPDLAARSRWPLDEIATPMLGSGKRGAKA